MTEENKKRVRNEIAKDSRWIIVDGILGESVRSIYYNKSVKIIYVDMDSQPQICMAHYDYKQNRFVGDSEWLRGNIMCGVIAYLAE